MFKKKINILLCAICVASVMFTACGSKEAPKQGTSTQVANVQQPEVKKVEEKKEEKKAPLDALKDEFKKKGFEVGENETVAFNMMGATNGYKYKLNGQLIEFYIYEESKLTPDGKEQFKQAKNGSVSMGGFNVKVNYTNGFVVARLDEHKDKDKILEVVKSFKQ